MVVVRRLKCVRRQLPAFLGRWRRWRLAPLIAASLAQAPTISEALAQNSGCARCGQPVSAPPAAFAPTVRQNEPAPRRSASRRESKHKLAMALAWTGGSYTVCVRACDGAFFPVTYFGQGSRADTLEQVCRSLCPGAEVALYSFPFGGSIDEAVSSSGEPYVRLPTADKFVQSFDPSCSCRAPGQSWAEALAAAEAKYGRHSHDILVTVEDAKRMSRPVQDPRAKPIAADPGQPDPAALAEPPPGLDINGVDTTLSAATKAISRETSGIRDEDAEGPASFGLKQGQTVDEKGPDGAIRRVRVLPATF